jgi:hypothetical protein
MASHPLNPNAYSSIPNELLTVGMGDVDKITIIKDGDIQNWPKVETMSQSMTC